MMEFKLPDIGEGVHEGEITKWLVGAGDSVEVDQPMVEVMTDKATVEIPSPVEGTVKELLADEGKTVDVGAVIITIETAGGAAVEAPKKEAASVPSQELSSSPAPQAASSAAVSSAPQGSECAMEAEVVPFKVLATPATRKLARDLGVDLRSVKGSGPHQRVTKVDVQTVFEMEQAAVPRTSHSMAVAPSAPKVPAKPLVVAGDIQRVPLKGIRKRIAQAMVHSKHTAAHFTYVEEVNMSEVVKLRKSAKPEAEAQGVKLTFLPFIIKAVIPALKEFPYFNSSLDDATEEIILKGDYNIGVATDTPQGLMVPVIKAADQKNIFQLAQEVTELSERARNGKSTMDDLKGGTFTLTNAGSLGGIVTTPVINHPEVAILGINAIRQRPIVEDGEIKIADMLYLSLSVDHRVVDGADAASFYESVGVLFI